MKIRVILKSVKLAKMLIAFFFITACFVSRAATITTIASGNWSSTSVWPGGIIPTATDDIVVGATFTLTVDGNRTCNSLQVGNGSTISVNTGIVLTITTSLSFPNAASASTTGTVAGAGTINTGSMSIAGTIIPISSQTVTVTSTISSLNVTGNTSVTSQRAGVINNNPTFRLQSGTVTI